jgi:hypothetical protein
MMPASAYGNPNMQPSMLQFLPAGITPADYANMPPDHQFLLEEQMM